MSTTFENLQHGKSPALESSANNVLGGLTAKLFARRKSQEETNLAQFRDVARKLAAGSNLDKQSGELIEQLLANNFCAETELAAAAQCYRDFNKLMEHCVPLVVKANTGKTEKDKADLRIPALEKELRELRRTIIQHGYDIQFAAQGIAEVHNFCRDHPRLFEDIDVRKAVDEQALRPRGAGLFGADR